MFHILQVPKEGLGLIAQHPLYFIPPYYFTYSNVEGIFTMFGFGTGCIILGVLKMKILPVFLGRYKFVSEPWFE